MNCMLSVSGPGFLAVHSVVKMRKIRLSEKDFALFDIDLSPIEFEFFQKHRDAFKRMWHVQGKKFWIRFVLSFRAFSVNYGVIKQFPGKRDQYDAFIDQAFIYIHEQFVDGKVSTARNLVLDVVVVAQNRHTIQYLDSKSRVKDPFYCKETRDVFRRLFGSPDEKSSYMKVYFLIGLFIKFGGSVCQCLRRWLEADDQDSADESYWTPPGHANTEQRVTKKEKVETPKKADIPNKEIPKKADIPNKEEMPKKANIPKKVEKPNTVEKTEKPIVFNDTINNDFKRFVYEKFKGSRKGPIFVEEWKFGDPRFCDPKNPLYDPTADRDSDWRDKVEYPDFLTFLSYLRGGREFLVLQPPDDSDFKREAQEFEAKVSSSSDVRWNVATSRRKEVEAYEEPKHEHSKHEHKPDNSCEEPKCTCAEINKVAMQNMLEKSPSASASKQYAHLSAITKTKNTCEVKRKGTARMMCTLQTQTDGCSVVEEASKKAKPAKEKEFTVVTRKLVAVSKKKVTLQDATTDTDEDARMKALDEEIDKIVAQDPSATRDNVLMQLVGNSVLEGLEEALPDLTIEHRGGYFEDDKLKRLKMVDKLTRPQRPNMNQIDVERMIDDAFENLGIDQSLEGGRDVNLVMRLSTRSKASGANNGAQPPEQPMLPEEQPGHDGHPHSPPHQHTGCTCPHGHVHNGKMSKNQVDQAKRKEQAKERLRKKHQEKVAKSASPKKESAQDKESCPSPVKSQEARKSSPVKDAQSEKAEEMKEKMGNAAKNSETTLEMLNRLQESNAPNLIKVSLNGSSDKGTSSAGLARAEPKKMTSSASLHNKATDAHKNTKAEDEKTAAENTAAENTAAENTGKDRTRRLRDCANCGVTEDAPKKFKKCQKCSQLKVSQPRYYCGRDCQAEDWKARHRQEHADCTLVG